MTSAKHLAAGTFRILTICICTFILFQFISVYLSWQKQAVLGAACLVLAMIANRRKTHAVTLALMLLSIAATLRYGWWRIHMVVDFFTDESNNRISIDAALMLILLSAEAYTFGIMVLGYMQTSQTLKRKPIPLPADEAEWPHVDLLIPTYNEPLSLVRYTALAAINIDYPPDKLHVYILDDGTRADFKAFAEEAGVGYITREKHNHAKAGNINHALSTMNSPLVSIFDCDHVPTRSFLQVTVGWFLKEKKLAMLQTPHFFYSPDPFERNLLQYKSTPNEGELFYGILQDGNDLWDATFFCGSCAVIRREALNEVGGIATETVTEDAHTSLRMQKKGWSTAYINMAQAAGLATETLSAHVGQRVRWARGMIQILRTDNPLFARGMKLTQRLCYFNAMMHFMYAVPRLIFLVAPLAYMLFGRTIIPGYWLAILAYALPHLIISSMTNSRIQGRHRHSFWNEIYETVLAPYILLPTILALINPKLGSFNVTDKGTTLSETRFDRKIAAPTTWLLLLNFAGVLAAPYRMYLSGHPGVILSNLFWIVFNIVILGVAAAVAHEQKQRRSSIRIPVHIQVVATMANGQQVYGETNDMSVGGASVVMDDPEGLLSAGEPLYLAFPDQTGDAAIHATVIATHGKSARLHFENLAIEEQETLTRALYCRADSWIKVRNNVEEDRPMVSLGRIVMLSGTGLKQVFLGLLPQKKSHGAAAMAARTASLLLFLFVWFAGMHVAAQQPVMSPANITVPGMALAPAVNAQQMKITLKDMGVLGVAPFRGPHSYYSAHFVLPHTMLPRQATLQLGYRFVRGLNTAASIQVRLNNTLITTVQASGVPSGPQFNVVEVPVSPDMLIRDNDLTFEFTGNGLLQTGDRAKSQILASIADSSTLEIAGDPLPFSKDLGSLPLPLFDTDLQTTTTVPFVFASAPTPKMLQAAGVVASWFGVLASSKPVRFSVSVGQIPAGNAIVFTSRSAGTAPAVQSPAGGSLQLKQNPSDPSGSILMLTGDNEDQLLDVARTLAMIKGASPSATDTVQQGDTLRINSFAMPEPRVADDAPRWMPTNRPVSLWEYSGETNLKSDGSKPLPLYFRVPPDLYYGETQNLRLIVNYRYNARSIVNGSALRTFVNGTLINEAPLQTGGGVIGKQRQVVLPVAGMRPFANTLLFNFDFVPARGAAGDLQGSILKNSYLDIRGIGHWAAMPNLELFANAGFPFTQYADLSHTVVLLPKIPSPAEIRLYLQLMSHFGTQTGYPALSVRVNGPDDLVQEDADYLILGSFANQPAFSALQDDLPVSFGANQIRVKQPDSYRSQLANWWARLTGTQPLSASFEKDAYLADAVMEGMQSPYARGKSLVVVALRDDATEPLFTKAFLDRSQSSDMAHSVSLLRAGHFASYDFPVAEYHIGTVSRYTELRILLARNFLLLLVALVFCSLVLGKFAQHYLNARANERLRAQHMV